MPLTVVSDLGLPVSAEAWEINNRTSRELSEKSGAMGANLEAITNGSRPQSQGLWDNPDALGHGSFKGFPADRTNVFGLDYTKFPDEMRIGIPTAHVYGRKDPSYPSSMQLAHFCDEGKRNVLDHGGGHDIPRTMVVTERIVELVRWLERMIKE